MNKTEYKHLIVEPFERYCVLTLNRPDVRNALSAAMRAELLDFLEHCEDRYQAVIVTGAGKGFCAGLDLTEGSGEVGTRELWAIGRKIYDSSSIFVAAVNGAARGGGLSLVNICDLAVSSTEATFGIPEIGFGVYATIAGPTTQFAAPKKLTAKMVLTGAPISAEEALKADLLNDVVAPDQLMSSAKAIADRLVSLSPDALAIAKQGINRFPFSDEARSAAVDLSIELNSANLAKT